MKYIILICALCNFAESASNTEVKECGGTYYTTHGVISFPFSHSPSPHSLHCVYTISPGETVYLTTTNGDADIDMNTVKVTDADGKHYGGADLVKYNLQSSRFDVEFNIGDSDGHTFQITWDKTFLGCNKTINSTTGMLESPGYPSNYENDVTCVYTIHSNNVTQITIDDLDLREGKDLLQVTGLDYNGEVQHVFYTGTQKNVTLNGRKFVITFTSDSDGRSGRGFHLTWKEAEGIWDDTYEDTDPHGCSGVFVGAYGYLESPNYPDNYYPDSICNYIIYDDQVKDIRLEVQDFQLVPLEDYLLVNVSERGELSEHIYGNYTGDELHPKYSINGAYFDLELVNDGNDTARGFRLTWAPLSKHVDPTKEMAVELPQCQTTYNSRYGVIESPNYPQSYPVFADCFYTINITEEVELILDDMAIEEDYDFVEIRRYNGNEYITIQSLTGRHRLRDDLSWRGTGLQVYFRSDETNGDRGFRFTWRAKAPGGERVYNHEEGAVRDILVECTNKGLWVSVPINSSTELFPNISMSDLTLDDPSCTSKVYSDGCTLSSPLLGCGMTREETDDYIIYKNTIRIPHEGEDVITRHDTLDIPVECHMSREASAVGYYWPKHRNTMMALGFGNFTLYMDLYRDYNHSDRISTYPSPVELDEELFVDVKMDAKDANLKIAPRTCLAKPSLSTDDFSDAYYLIRNGCPTDQTVQMGNSTPTHIDFRFRTFEFLRKKEDVYIFCYITVCNGSDVSRRCNSDCDNLYRKRRDVTEGSDHDLYIVQGPLRFSSKRNSDLSDRSGNTTGTLVAVATIMAVSAMLMVLAAVAMVIVRRKMARKQSNDSPSL
ncbi:CUB and zona pellucida-like domain-containing protein 1 [Haliotis cracherodii]|uniref:CUB and zona pellucida-like domain-containing protein 1 n=1 Tax=Haliotis cracherodii TaxID=6455 RepID=UPI0039EC3371